MVSAENVAQAILMLTFQKELCNLQGMNTSGEVANLLTLAENAAYTGEIIKNLTELEGVYQEIASGTLTPGQLDAKLARAAELENAIKESAGNIKYEPQINFNSMGGAASHAAGAGKSAAESYIEAFEEELSDLSQLRDNGVITEKEYLDSLRALYERYFANKLGYEKEYAKYQRNTLRVTSPFMNPPSAAFPRCWAIRLTITRMPKMPLSPLSLRKRMPVLKLSTPRRNSWRHKKI